MHRTAWSTLLMPYCSLRGRNSHGRRNLAQHAIFMANPGRHRPADWTLRSFNIAMGIGHAVQGAAIQVLAACRPHVPVLCLCQNGDMAPLARQNTLAPDDQSRQKRPSPSPDDPVRRCPGEDGSVGDTVAAGLSPVDEGAVVVATIDWLAEHPFGESNPGALLDARLD
jgi:hypothetical protein